MKNYFFILFYIITTINIFAQNGYLNFQWGMSLSEINNNISDNDSLINKENSLSRDPLHFMMFYFYGTEISNSFGNRLEWPISWIRNGGGRRYNTYYTSRYENWWDGGLGFILSNNRLIGVQTIFRNANIIKELETRYGRGTEVNLTSGNGRIWLNNERFIVWIHSEDSDRFVRNNTLEFLAYFDSTSVIRICQEAMEDNRSSLRERRNEQRNRLE